MNDWKFTKEIVDEIDRLIGECRGTRRKHELERSRALLAQLRKQDYSGLSIADCDRLIHVTDRRIRRLEQERDRVLLESIRRTSEDLHAADLAAWKQKQSEAQS